MSIYFSSNEWMSSIQDDTIPSLINVNTGVEWELILDKSNAKPVNINMCIPYAVPMSMQTQDNQRVRVQSGMIAVHSMRITGFNSTVNDLLRIFYDRFKIDVRWTTDENGNHVAEGYTVEHKPESEWQIK